MYARVVEKSQSTLYCQHGFLLHVTCDPSPSVKHSLFFQSVLPELPLGPPHDLTERYGLSFTVVMLLFHPSAEPILTLAIG